jgi:hypothetical protein
MVPVLEPFGTLTMTGPSGVGTLIFAPSTASLSVTGTSTWMSSPCWTKNLWGLTEISTSASPVDRAAIGQGQALARAVHRIEEVDSEPVVHVGTGRTPGLTGLAPQQFREEVIGLCKIGKARGVFIGVATGRFGGIVPIVTLAGAFRT